MSFRASFCDPFRPNVIELGRIDKSAVFDKFESYAWDDMINKMKTAKESEIYYSPSFELENIENKNGLTASAINGKEWYLFFKRPTKLKKWKWFKSVEYIDEDYMSDLTGQSIEDVKECMQALLDDNLEYLESKFV